MINVTKLLIKRIPRKVPRIVTNNLAILDQGVSSEIMTFTGLVSTPITGGGGAGRAK